MPPQLPNENTVKEQYDCYNALLTVTTLKNVKIRKPTNNKIMYKNEKWQHQGWKQRPMKTNTQTHIKIYHNSHSTRTGETNCTNSQARRWRSYGGATLRILLICFRVFAFVLHRHVNLNKERNKWASCLRVAALAINTPPPRLSWEGGGGARGRWARGLEVVWIPTNIDVFPLNKGITLHVFDSRCWCVTAKHLYLLFGGFKVAVDDVDSGWYDDIDGCLSRPPWTRTGWVFLLSFFFFFSSLSSFFVFNMWFPIKEWLRWE